MEVIRIEALGGFGLLVNGENRTATVPRKLAAVLGVLAVHGERGVARDRLVSLLWSDVDLERARHAFAQSLYSIRRLLGSEDVIVGTSHLLLNASSVSTDVADLERAAERGDDDALLSLYRGAVLEGFTLPGAGELDRWLDERRADLLRRVCGALDQMAQRHGADGRHDRAVTILNRRVSLDPLDAAATLSLMRAHASSGNVHGAVQQARVYAALVRQELELEPDARVAQLAEALQRDAGPQRAAIPAGQAPDVIAEPRWRAWRARLGTFVPRPSRQLQLMARRGAVTAVSIMVALLALAHLGDQRARRAIVREGVVVTPFRAVGLSTDLAHLPAAVVELLSVAMAARDTSPVVDPVQVHRWWDEHQEDLRLAPTESVVLRAATLGAGQVVAGMVVGDARLLVIRAALIDQRTGVVVRAGSAQGSLDSLPVMIDRLADALANVVPAIPAADTITRMPDSSVVR